MTDTTKMRAVVQDGNYKNVWLDGSTHYEGCEYSHYPCAVLKLCEDVDRLREALHKTQWDIDDYCGWCGQTQSDGHLEVCPIEKVWNEVGRWEAPNG